MPAIGQLPRDESNNAIQTMRIRPGGAHQVAATTGASARNATGFLDGVKVVSLYATADMYIRFGNAAVAAANTDTFFPAGVWYDVAIDGAVQSAPYTHIAARAVTANGTLYITERF